MILHILTGKGYDDTPMVVATSLVSEVRPLILSFPAYTAWHLDTWERVRGDWRLVESVEWRG